MEQELLNSCHLRVQTEAKIEDNSFAVVLHQKIAKVCYVYVGTVMALDTYLYNFQYLPIAILFDCECRTNIHKHRS